MSDWPSARVGDLAQWRGGQTPSLAESTFWDGGDIPWVSSKEVVGGVLKDTERKVTRSAVERTALRLVPAGSVVVVVRSGILQHTFPVALVPFPTTVNQDIKVGVPTGDVLPEYLALCLSAYGEAILQQCRKSGTTVQSIDMTRFLDFEVPLPSQVEQRRIGHLIGSVDRQISALAREERTLRNLYGNLLVSCLSRPYEDREPIRVQLGSCLTLDVDRVAVRATESYHMAGVLNAGKGMIDRGWTVGSATDYATLNRLRAGQLVMRKLTAWEGPICVVPDSFDGTYASAEFPTFTPREARLLPAFLAHLCRWPGLWHEMRQRVTGSVQRRKRLNPDQLLDVDVPLPHTGFFELEGEAGHDLRAVS